MEPALVLLISLMLVQSSSTQLLHYVKSNDSSSQDCHGQPCLTLDQYIHDAEEYFTTGTTFIFLDGQHTLQRTINLTSVSDVILTQEDYSQVNLTCISKGGLVFENVSNVTIKGLVFIISQSDIKIQNPSFLSFVRSRQIRLLNVTFQGNGQLRAIYSKQSFLTIVSCHFEDNSGNNGGALLAVFSVIMLNGNNFTKNKATRNGGAICAVSSSINIQSLQGNVTDNSLATIFLGNVVNSLPKLELERDGGAILLQNSTLTMNGESVIFANNSADQGGAISCRIHSVIYSTTKNLHFLNNTASHEGGAIFLNASSLYFGHKVPSFPDINIDVDCDILAEKEKVEMMNATTILSHNHAVIGGAIFLYNATAYLSGTSMIFDSNSAKYIGGAIVSMKSCVILGVAFTGKLKFRNNSAKSGDKVFYGNTSFFGGAIASENSQIKAQAQELKFIENFAVGAGGAINAVQHSELTMLSANFIQNKATFGGAIRLSKESTATFSGATRFDQNSGVNGGALYVVSAFVRLQDYTVFLSNKANNGGAINGVETAKFVFDGLTIFDNNIAERNGGAIYGVETAKFMFNGQTIFDKNIAEYGGGIYAVYTNITFTNTVQFTSNSALNGGAMFFESGTILTIEKGTNLTTSYNHASKYGGVIYHADSATAIQCDYSYARKDLYNLFSRIPYCFIHLNVITFNGSYYYPCNIESYYDSAGKDGSYIYGGLLDKCQTPVIDSFTLKHHVMMNSISVMHFLKLFLRFTPINNTNKGISSEPYQLCFCQNHSYVDCFGKYGVEVYRGQKFNVSLVATAQGDVYITSSTQVTVKLNPTARLDLNQSSQVIKNCSVVTYNVYSTEEYEELVVYPADGPCIDRGLARAVIEVTLLPCPDGFTQSSEQCACEERLQAYDADCTIDEMIFITKRSTNFWMSVLYINESYQGLILYEICPSEYCKSGNVSMSLDDVNIQCNFNRTGILCGACDTNYSLLLGSSTCQICSNMYLSSLVPFALAGLGLVIFLTFLRLTVATGLINSFILYANIVQANKSLFFPPNTRNLLTVFIAWMNLDLGFKTCFYDGMDGYAQTWLQFAFPLYVWILISLIIIFSRYSIKVSKLIGSNPIAVLATLLLLSYTKILKIIIEVFSSVKLDYPDNKKVTVWLKDANVPYMEHKHLILAVATFCITISFFLPYTLLLLFGYKLYSFQWCRKYFHCWLMRFRPLLDSYNAPYNIRHQYWTGFMLLVRCALYIVFSYNSLGETNGSLLAIIVVFVSIGFFLLLTRVYKKMSNNIIEVCMYLNLIVLSTVTLAYDIIPALVYTSVGVTFATFISMCVYHLYIFYMHQTWLNFKARFANADDQSLLAVADTPPEERIVTKSVAEFRESLLES